MKQVNAVGYDTPRGYRIAELIHGDLTHLSPAVDVLVGSTFIGDCSPVGNSLIRDLVHKGIDVPALAVRPALNFRDALGVWVSSELERGPAKRLLFVEMRGRVLPLNEAMENVFAVLSVLEAKGISILRVAMPLLGAGSQGYPPEEVIEAILPQVRSFLKRSVDCSVLSFVERNPGKVDALSMAMDSELGRRGRSLSYSELARSVCKDVINRTMEAGSLFADCSEQKAEWLQILHADRVNASVFGVHARKLVELFLARSGYASGSLHDRIRKIRESKSVAPWICAYMDVIRQLGNDGAHVNEATHFEIEEIDLVTTLFCVERLLGQWISSHGPAVPGTATLTPRL